MIALTDEQYEELVDMAEAKCDHLDEPTPNHPYEPYMSRSHHQTDVMCGRNGCGASRTNPVHHV